MKTGPAIDCNPKLKIGVDLCPRRLLRHRTAAGVLTLCLSRSMVERIQPRQETGSNRTSGVLFGDRVSTPSLWRYMNLKKEPRGQFAEQGQLAEPANRQGDTPTSKPVGRRLFLMKVASALAFSLLCGGVAWSSGDAAAQGNSPTQLRRFIEHQVGGIEKLMVPANNSDLPQPHLPDGSPDPFSKTTEAKRYLGKQLYFDPIRTARIRTEFGGVLATKQTASCGSCHLGEAASKSGTRLNFAVGGEGRSYTDAAGNFIPRRRPRVDILPKLRETPLFPGDALVDEIPTLTDIFEFAVGSPARGRKLPDPGKLLRTGRLDALDSVARNAPGASGAAFNNRLLMGGFAGEPDSSPGGLNPFGFVAQESVALLLLDAHRMLEFQSAELQKFPTYRKLFREAFPEEAAQADAAGGDLNLLINDLTVLRATAT